MDAVPDLTSVRSWIMNWLMYRTSWAMSMSDGCTQNSWNVINFLIRISLLASCCHPFIYLYSVNLFTVGLWNGRINRLPCNSLTSLMTIDWTVESGDRPGNTHLPCPRQRRSSHGREMSYQGRRRFHNRLILSKWDDCSIQHKVKTIGKQGCQRTGQIELCHIMSFIFFKL